MHTSIVNLGDYNGYSAGVSVDSAHSIHVGIELSARRHLSPRGPEARCRLDSSTIGLLALGFTLVCLVARPDRVGFGAAWPGITTIGLCGSGAGQFIPMSIRLALYGLHARAFVLVGSRPMADQMNPRDKRTERQTCMEA
jgi:hypothetical protein